MLRTAPIVSAFAVALVSTLAFAASSVATSIASAAGIGGLAEAASSPRVVASVSQTTTAAALATLQARITLCSGAVEIPVFVASSATTAVATGSVYAIKATIVNATCTRFDVLHTGGPTGVTLIELGGTNSQVCFDRSQPGLRANGSSTGMDFALSTTASIGSWTAYATYRNPVHLAGTVDSGDLFGGVQV